MNESKEAFGKWKAGKGIQYNAAMAWQAAWDQQQDQIEELKKELKEWKSKSLAAMLHGTCNCGEPWQSIVSDKEGFNRLHCFKCNYDKYENKGFYGDHEPKE